MSENPSATVTIDRLRYAIEARPHTGRELRDLCTPPIPERYDLWLANSEGGEDSIVTDSMLVEPGARLFTVPKIINAGARSGVSENVNTPWVATSFFEAADYAIAKILGLFCGRCQRVTIPYVSEDMEWPCCGGCWQRYPA